MKFLKRFFLKEKKTLQTRKKFQLHRRQQYRSRYKLRKNLQYKRSNLQTPVLIWEKAIILRIKKQEMDTEVLAG